MPPSENQSRYQIAYVSAWNIVQLELRSPYVVTFWSMAYAGLGHILLERYFRGFILLVGEVLLNAASHLNAGIYYTMTGRFDMARAILDVRWLILYLAVYCFSIIDCYRLTITINNTYLLADRENAEIKPFVIKASGFTILSTVPPWLPALFSMILPGAGCFFLQRMNRALFLVTLWILLTYLSGFYPALIDTFNGNYDRAVSILNIQWFLNLPSVWIYGVSEAYNGAIETNKLYRKSQTQYLKKEYQSSRFQLPVS